MDKPVIELYDAFVIQDNLVQVLGNVTMKVKEGEFAYLIGKTGTGKSSLLKTLYADLPVREGRGEVAGYNLNIIERNEIPMLRRQIGMVFQDFNLLYDRSVKENLEFVLKATDWKNKTKIKNRIAEVLESVNLENILGKKPHELSGGEQQRVVIARALLNAPILILADEPTGNLDPEVSDEILELLHNIASQGTAVLMATHDYRLINKFPGTVYRIENGIVDQTSLFG
ncbi:ATP-binding cassette domain-containing protein [Bacteroidia bacterium]|nr:ATP-binding cassette domain-containing protein [Bacteroidia bacterium]MDC1395548.1 ATP-binding cassette domain-containing protein [Bacteroidia bacterium]